MLSILIPIYNQKVVSLVKALYQQCRKLKIDYEILCFDDLSKESIRSENRHLGSLFNINYMELSENLGRSKIRNWLAKSARYDNLLFIDCDSKITRKDFIKKYISAIENPYDIIHGGREYSPSPPRAKSKRLHWKYGTKRECPPAKKRTKHPHRYFHSNNFLIRKNIIKKFPFDEQLLGYGYEDLVMAQHLLSEGYNILALDNPVRHLGIEKNDVFLKKTVESIQNLVRFESRGLLKDTRLQELHSRLDRYGILHRTQQYLAKNMSKYEANLRSENPKLYQFDAFKLYHYIHEKSH